jgi:hypothetical protein
MNTRQLVQYIVLDKFVDFKNKNNKFISGDIEITKSEEIGDGSSIFTKTHLGKKNK